jgi:hypothetical protein
MQRNQKGSESAESGAPMRRGTRRTFRRAAALTIALGTAALALAACAGSGSGTPHVASLHTSASSQLTGGTGDGKPTATGKAAASQPEGNPIRLLEEWTACMRRHGDPSQAEPTIDATNVIHVVMQLSVPGGLLGPNSQSGPGPVPSSYCATYLTDASAALRGDDQSAPSPPSQAQLVKYADCMRANGVPDFPDPVAGGLQLHGAPGSDLDRNNPIMQKADKVCVKKTGVQPVYSGGPPPPGSIMEGPPGGPQHLAYVYAG